MGALAGVMWTVQWFGLAIIFGTSQEFPDIPFIAWLSSVVLVALLVAVMQLLAYPDVCSEYRNDRGEH
jgi:hypothetical protein